MATSKINDGTQLTVTLTSGQTAFKSGGVYVKNGVAGVLMSLTRDGDTVFDNAASAEGDVGVLALTGEFELPKETPLVINQGDAVYWDVTNSNVDKTNTNVNLGFASADAGSTDETVKVVLRQWV